MKMLRRTILFALAAVVVMSQSAYAHGLYPLYLGSPPFWLSLLGANHGYLLLPGVLLPLLLFHAFVLDRLVALDRSPVAVMWRAAAIFLLSSVLTAVPAVYLIVSAAWDGSWFEMVFLISGGLFLMAFTANALLTMLFFRHDAATQGRLFLAALIISVSSHVVLLASNYAVYSLQL